MKINLYENKYINLQDQPLFFGEGRNTLRFDKNKFNNLSDLALKMQRFFWVPEEIKLQKDRLDKESFTEAENHIYSTQLRKLVMLDSYQGRNPILTFGQLTTNPEFEACLIEQEYFESRLHSRSYSYIAENMYDNPDKFFKDSWKDKILLKHSETTISEGNNLYNSTIDYIYKTNHNINISESEMELLKKEILYSIVSMNILEGIRFYLGFSSIWAITEFTGKIPGSSRILQLIQRDEKQHLAFTQILINTLKKTKEFKEIWKSIQSKVYDMYFKACEEEFDWANHLYSKGSIMGINAEIGKSYIKYLANQRLLAIGLKPIYPEIKTNPIKWINKYINLHDTETSLQESESIDYISSPIKIENINISNIYKELL